MSTARERDAAEQALADLGVNLLTVSHIGIERPYQCECGWRGRTLGQRTQHQKTAKSDRRLRTPERGEGEAP